MSRGSRAVTFRSSPAPTCGPVGLRDARGRLGPVRTWRHLLLEGPVKRAIVAILAALGGLVLLGFLFLAALSWAVLSPTPLPSAAVLELDLERGIVEAPPQDPLALALERRQLDTRQVVEALERAAEDDRIKGLLVRGHGTLAGWGTLSEVRDAVQRFRESGKPALLFADTFGEFGSGQGSYYLASAFDQIILQPSGDVGLMPLTLEAPFLARMFEKLDVQTSFDRRWEYKDATEIFTRTGFSEPARESNEALLESILSSVVEGVAQGRDLAPDSVRSLVAAGPFMAREAEAAGLIDSLGYLDDARRRVLEEVGEEAERLDFDEYVERDGRVWNRGPRVALIYGSGVIERGRSGFDPLSGAASFGASTVAGHIRSAVEDDRVRAILFRVDSPGGSYVASDLVRRELARAKEEGKPVIVSMGNVAASGGYLVSLEADRIVAHPTTLTGSIGVLAGKFVTRDLWARLGIEWERIEAGGENTFFSPIDDFSDEEWEQFQDYLDRVYDEFVGLVAQGREMEVDAVDEVARGRVWTGVDARDRGLVDDLGGFTVAVAAVRDALELEPDEPIDLATVPAERTLFQLLMEDGWRTGVATWLGAGGSESEFMRALRPVWSRAAEGGLLGDRPGPVRMSPLEIPVR